MKNFARAAALLIVVLLSACGTGSGTGTSDSTTAQRTPTSPPATTQQTPTSSTGTTQQTPTSSTGTTQQTPTSSTGTTQQSPVSPPATAKPTGSAPDPLPPRPSGPFISTPSDLISGVWVLGTVTRGGPGPCYGFAADDGRELALRGGTVGTLTAGDRIRVLVRADEHPTDCGAGEPMVVMDVKRAG